VGDFKLFFPDIRDGFWGSIFMLELHKAGIMAMKFYGSRNVWNSSLFVQPILSSSKLGDLKFLRAPFQRIHFFWDVMPSLWVSAAHVSKDRLHPSSRVKRGVG
jgi:hypothetical protein